MKTLYLECNMGAAGDMLTAALFELIPNQQEFLEKINSVGLKGVEAYAEAAVKQGISGTRFTVKINGEEEKTEDVHEHTHHHGHYHDHEHHHHHHDHEHHHHHAHEHSHSHTSMNDIEHLIGHLNVSERVKSDALAVYSLIAEAESHAHGRPVSEIHFHEVGTMDAVADIVSVCLLIEMLSPDKIIASPVHVGSGSVRCAHGVLPVPAPATAYILRDVPMYGGSVEGELCTPTGAALLRHFVSEFGNMPVMKTKKIGYGMGKKDFHKINCVRAFLGETEAQSEQIVELICNLDDITGEKLAFAQELLLERGALDVFTLPVGMKKGRAGVMLMCLCRPEQRGEMLSLIFRHTTTIGVREHICDRYTLERSVKTVRTEYGEVSVKCSEGCGIEREKPEFDDIAKIARENDMTLEEVEKILIRQ